MGGERWEEVLLFHVQPLSFITNDVDMMKIIPGPTEKSEFVPENTNTV